MSNYGIRYVVVALGSKGIKVFDEDLRATKEVIDKTGFQGTILSDRVSDKLTVALLQERGAL